MAETTPPQPPETAAQASSKESKGIRFPLKWQFTAIISLTITIITFSISQIIFSQQIKVLTDDIKTQGYLVAKNLVSIAQEALTTYDDLPIYNAISDIKKEKFIEEVFLLNTRGIVLAHSDIYEKGKQYDTKTFTVTQADGKYVPNLIKRKENTYFDFAMPVFAYFPTKKHLADVHILVNKKVIDDKLSQAKRLVFFLIILFLALGVLSSMLISDFVTRPIMKIADGAKIIGQGNLEHKIDIKRADELGLLATQFNKMTSELSTAQGRLIEQQRMEYSLKIATDIQNSLLPQTYPQIPGVSFGSYYKSAKEIGGDYYDVFQIDENHVGIVIADVSGKDVPGAMVMVMARAIIKSQALTGLDTRETLVRTNHQLYQDIKPGMFVSAFYGIFDHRTKTLEYTNAGHDPLIVYRAASRTTEKFGEREGMALGAKKNKFFSEKIIKKSLTLNKGDMMVLYTDGIPESINKKREMYDFERFHEVVRQKGHLSNEDFIRSLMDSITTFIDGAEQFDDIAITTLKVL